MKFFHLLILALVIISFTLSKKHRREINHVPAQSGRNYIKPREDPSLNPLPKEYYTGPITNYAPIAPKKYQPYNRYLSSQHNYLDTTSRNAQRGIGKPVSTELRKKKLLRRRRR